NLHARGLNEVVTPTPDDHQNAFSTRSLGRLDRETAFDPSQQLTHPANFILVLDHIVQSGCYHTGFLRQELGPEFIIHQWKQVTRIIAANIGHVTAVHSQNTGTRQGHRTHTHHPEDLTMARKRRNSDSL